MRHESFSSANSTTAKGGPSAGSGDETSPLLHRLLGVHRRAAEAVRRQLRRRRPSGHHLPRPQPQPGHPVLVAPAPTRCPRKWMPPRCEQPSDFPAHCRHRRRTADRPRERLGMMDLPQDGACHGNRSASSGQLDVYSTAARSPIRRATTNSSPLTAATSTPSRTHAPGVTAHSACSPPGRDPAAAPRRLHPRDHVRDHLGLRHLHRARPRPRHLHSLTRRPILTASVLAAVLKFQRDVISENTREGRRTSRARRWTPEAAKTPDLTQ